MKRNNYPTPGAKTWMGASMMAVAVMMAACGGGGGDDDEPAPAPTPAPAPAPTCATQVNDTKEKLMACVTLEGVKARLQTLQDISNANGGNRASGNPGHLKSVEYAEKVFKDAGYDVSRQTFSFIVFEDKGGSVLEQLTPTPVTPIAHQVMSYSGSGTANATVTKVANLGCNEADFAGFTAGHIALISRGECPFGQKATNAVAKGASGVVIYNNADGDLNGTLGDTFTGNVPVVSVSKAVGTELAGKAGLTMRIVTSTTRTTTETYNVIAESKTGDATRVVMAGAHLDSVHEGPGINDNGTGSAAILETAVQMAKVTPRNKVRFALWGAEESGLLGSEHYVATLSAEEKAKIQLYMNFDMIGSPNPGYFIYDGDNSDNEGEGAGPEGSAGIEKTFEAFYTERGKPFQGTDFDGRSDYGPFIANDIPAGGLFTGAEDIMTPEQAALWGGEAGKAFDKCYHQACDDMTNLNDAALDLNSDAVAYATLHYAMSTEEVRAKALSATKGKYVPPSDMRPKHLPVLR